MPLFNSALASRNKYPGAENLPEAVLFRIFSFLELRDKYAALTVCTEWCRVLEAPSLWTKLSLTDHAVPERVLETILQHPRFRNLETVELPHKTGKAVVHQLVRNCHAIRSLKIRLNKKDHLCDLQPLLSRVEHCCISYPQEPQFYLHRPNDLDLLPPGTWRNLRHGCFPGGLSDAGLDTLCNSPYLTSLDLSRCDSISERGIQAVLQRLGNLQLLSLPAHLRDPERLSDVLEHVQGPLQLRALYSAGMSDTCLSRLVSKCPSLEVLYINPHIWHFNNRNRSSGVETLGQGAIPICSRIRALGFRASQTSIIDSMLANALLCSRLEYLCLFLVAGSFSDESAGTLARNCTNLRALALRGKMSVSRSALCHLSSCKSLQSLSFIHCSLDYLAVDPVLAPSGCDAGDYTAWPSLHDLAIIGQEACTFGSLVSLVLSCSRLRVVTLDDPNLIDRLTSDVGLDLPSLRISKGDGSMHSCSACRQIRSLYPVCCLGKCHKEDCYF